MDRITLDQLRQAVIERHHGLCISLYMPVYRAGRETEQNPIRFKNLLRQAEEQLLGKGVRPALIRELLKAPQSLFQDQAFWLRQSDGLAVFFSEDFFQCFRLPIEFAELVVISDRFHVKPLLPFLTADGTFFVLAVSQNQLRVFEGTRYTIHEIEMEGIPRSLAETLPEGFLEKQLQFHTGTQSVSGSRSAIFHGHDMGNEIKNRLRQWFRTIDAKVRAVLPRSEAPLVLAGVDTLYSLYREVNTYAHFMDEWIAGNPEGTKIEELHQKAWAIVEPEFKKNREAARTRYQHLAGTGQTTTNVAEAAVAAHHGRIEVLFVSVGVQLWGRYDQEKDGIDLHETPEPGDGDLLDLTAIHTLINGGIVYAVSPDEVPEKAYLAAVLRY